MDIKYESAVIRFVFIVIVWVGLSELFILPQAATAPKANVESKPKTIFKSAPVTLPDKTKLKCELADTYYTRMIGLSHHKPSPDVCMLFIYKKPRVAYFWMPPTMQFNIDIIFMDERGCIVHITSNVKPCKAEKLQNCQQYGSQVAIKYVLEVAAGVAQKHALRKQQNVIINF